MDAAAVVAFAAGLLPSDVMVWIVWVLGMDSNHELDKILKSHNLLILKNR